MLTVLAGTQLSTIRNAQPTGKGSHCNAVAAEACPTAYHKEHGTQTLAVANEASLKRHYIAASTIFSNLYTQLQDCMRLLTLV